MIITWKCKSLKFRSVTRLVILRYLLSLLQQLWKLENTEMMAAIVEIAVLHKTLPVCQLPAITAKIKFEEVAEAGREKTG